MTSTTATRTAAFLNAAADLAPEQAARVAWTTLVEPGDAIAGALITEHGAIDALGVILDDAHTDIDGIDELRDRTATRNRPDNVVAALRAAQRVSAQLITPGTDEWPTQLDDLGTAAPIALWVRGDVATLHGQTTTSVVGARAATSYGEFLCREITADLIARGHTIASGGAYGVDAAAHRAALAADGKTIAALAGGVDRFHPHGNEMLLARIEETGAVISEVPCGSAPTRHRFNARQRILAALAARTVIVEAGIRSGSLQTATHAAALGRPVGSVPGPVTSPSSAGCHRLIAEARATLVTNADDIAAL